jgi:NADH-quinone oxidoreductase subunit G
LTEQKPLKLNVCFGTSCLLRGAQSLYTGLMDYVRDRGIDESTEMKVSFCREVCEKGPILDINGRMIEHCTVEMAAVEIDKII